MTQPKPQLGITIFLYIFGLTLIVTAIIILLKGFGIVSWIPSYVIWALVLLTIGCGILAAINQRR